MSQGYIRLHRQLQDCWVWNGERFSKGQAWVDLLMMANHKDVKIPFGDHIEVIKRGQFITSIAKLADKWMWSFNTVKKFLNLLESDHMLIRKSDNTKTLITIVNYEVYQYSEDENSEDIDRPTDRLADRPTDGQRADLLTDRLTPNNNDNNENNDIKNIKREKKTVKRFIPPTVDEVRAYCQERHNGIDPETFVDFYSSKGWKVGSNPMKDWKAAVRTWEKRNKKTEPEVPKNDISKLKALENYYINQEV